MAGEGYAFPKYLAGRYPEIAVKVGEIDPGITRFGREDFFLRDRPNLRTVHQDARVFLRRGGAPAAR